MRCTYEGCYCMCHVTLATHVPVCPRHSAPLQNSQRETGKGYCPECYARNLHAHWHHDAWAWRHKDGMSAEDYPPGNGYKPLVIPQALL